MLHTASKKNWQQTKCLALGTLLACTISNVTPVWAQMDQAMAANVDCVWASETLGQLTQANSQARLHPEPEDALLVAEDVNIGTGLYTRAYSRQQNGTIDYKTARQIVISEFNEHWNTVVHTKEFPLFYWEDEDQDGEFDMWIDQQGDGAHCDIVPYRIHLSTEESDLSGL